MDFCRLIIFAATLLFFPIHATQSVEFHFEKNDNFVRQFKKNDLPILNLYQMIRDIPDCAFQKIRANQYVQVWLNANQQIERLRWHIDRDNLWDIQLTNGQFTGQLRQIPPQEQFQTTTFFIKHSFFQDGKRAGIPSPILLALQQALTPNVAFDKLPAGTSITILFNTLPNHQHSTDSIRLVEIKRPRHTSRFYRFHLPKQKSFLLYDNAGFRMGQRFAQYPLDQFTVTSCFSTNRLHPILKVRRPHHGIDLAAKRGTPVKSTADGTIVFTGERGGYGKVIEIQHDQNIRTIYAHLHNFSTTIKPGQPVHKGQVIGTVGATGAATGPHVHYEVRLNGIPQNPAQFAPSSRISQGKILSQFGIQVRYLQEVFDLLKKGN